MLLYPVILKVCIAVAILGVTWFFIRDDVRLRQYGRNASEAYVIFYRPQPVYYRLESRGSKKFADVILEETSAHRLPKYAALILVKVVFIGTDGSPTLSCSLPSPKGVMSSEDVLDYWEQKLQRIETATRVPQEEIVDKLEKKELYFLRRRSKKSERRTVAPENPPKKNNRESD